ncbi:carbohydrate esterase family 4 protein [Flagelloscypha sp. PMI_526]|nr:carbohydrate esterase family 4 protein [Flagelloscypha sp. PMI_526]
MLNKFTLAAAALPLLASASAPCARHDHSSIAKRVPGTWYHARDHPAHELFGRADTFPAIGTPEWSAGFPPPLISTLGADQYGPLANLKPAWKAALDAAVQAGKIPNVPQSSNGAYPQGTNPSDKSVCSAVTKSCRIDGDIWDAPDGVFASSFDDGPTTATPTLLKFLDDNKVTTTHFMIGTAILQAVDAFKLVAASDNDLAVHTWSHRQMTTLPNEQVVGELGWTMQLIYNSTGGKLPKYWRPPTGDTDARVSAIAREVFGLTTVIWNQDSEDWTIGTPNGATQDKVQSDIKGFIDNQPKSPGLMVLEHELSDTTVQIFMTAFPEVAAKGWKFQSLASSYGGSGAYSDDAGDLSMFGNAPAPASNSSTGASASGSGSAATGSKSTASSKPSSSTNSTGSTSNGNSASLTSSLSFATCLTAVLVSAGLLLIN